MYLRRCKICKSEGDELVEVHLMDGHYSRQGVKCVACDTIHFFEDGKLTYRFYPTRAFGGNTFE